MHRNDEALRQRARESRLYGGAPGRYGAPPIPYGYYDAEINPKATHHYPVGMDMKIEGNIEEIEPQVLSR